MRHFYFRLILGIVFVACMIFSFVTMNIPFALLYLFLSCALLFLLTRSGRTIKMIGGKCHEQPFASLSH